LWRGLREYESDLRSGRARKYRSASRRSADCRLVDPDRRCYRSHLGGEPRSHVTGQCDCSSFPGCPRGHSGDDRTGDLVDRCLALRPESQCPAGSIAQRALMCAAIQETTPAFLAWRLDPRSPGGRCARFGILRRARVARVCSKSGRTARSPNSLTGNSEDPANPLFD